MGPWMALGVVGAIAAAAVLPLMISRQPDPLDKLKAAAAAPARGAGGAGAQGTRGPVVKLRAESGPKKLERFAHFLEPQNQEELSAARLKLLQAGYRSRDSVRTFHLAQMVLGVGLMLLGMLYALVTAGDQMEMQTLALAVVMPGAIGYYLPTYWVERRRQTRQEEITNGFPDSLDLMLVCVEAGQSLDQSIIRVAEEIRTSYPALSDEYEIVAWEIKAGKDKVNVLRDMAERCGVTDISSFTTVLIQSATFGTSIADALRVYAAEMRDKRVMRAEEKANVLPTKLTLGTMMFTVPPLLIILIGPSVHNIVEVLGNGGL
ncbi:MAG: type II secretion system F family protein [Rhodobacteraceae bacterium]|nr:type II secretion system F family protein [Paracoccaceae bacterium]